MPCGTELVNHEGCGMAADSKCLGIDTTRIYFREEIALLWGRDELDEIENTRRWFRTNFINRGLRTFATGKRIAVHGAELSEWILRNSTVRIDE